MELNSYDNVLNIITCGKSLESLSQEEKEKLVTICRGLSLDKSDELDIFRKRNILNDLDCKSFDEFSQEQKQRLVLTKILFLMRDNHQVMIFDEPTANLDKETTKKVFSFITEFCNRDRERMVIFSSHETDIASRYVDKVYEISNGVLRERVKIQSDREHMQRFKVGEKESRSCKFDLDKKCALEIEER